MSADECSPPRRSRITEAAGRGAVGSSARFSSSRCGSLAICAALLPACGAIKLAAVPETATETKRWICESCGFIYDPEEGDPDGGIAPGTAFEDIPDDWFCPVCGARQGLHPI